MAASFILALREGLEAALIIGIVIGVCNKIQRPGLKKAVWLGSGIAVLMSAFSAFALQQFGLTLEGNAEAIFEGSLLLLAAGLLTWMIFWMQRTAKSMKSTLETKTRQAAAQNKQRALFGLAFAAVFREGLELSLFLLAVQQTTAAGNVLLGAFGGLAAAMIAGWLLFASTRRLNLQNFFRLTNVLLIIFAAGMVAYGVHEFNEAAIIPAVIQPLWNLNPILNENEGVGIFLKTLFGYNGNPSLSEVLAYWSYLVIILLLILRKEKPMPAKEALSGNPLT